MSKLQPMWLECVVEPDGGEDWFSFDIYVNDFEGHDQGQEWVSGQKVQFIEMKALEQAEAKIKELEAKLTIAMEALEEINKKELSSQRPGGGYSKSATLSYQALEKIKD